MPVEKVLIKSVVQKNYSKSDGTPGTGYAVVINDKEYWFNDAKIKDFEGKETEVDLWSKDYNGKMKFYGKIPGSGGGGNWKGGGGGRSYGKSEAELAIMKLDVQLRAKNMVASYAKDLAVALCGRKESNPIAVWSEYYDKILAKIREGSNEPMKPSNPPAAQSQTPTTGQPASTAGTNGLTPQKTFAKAVLNLLTAQMNAGCAFPQDIQLVIYEAFTCKRGPDTKRIPGESDISKMTEEQAKLALERWDDFTRNRCAKNHLHCAEATPPANCKILGACVYIKKIDEGDDIPF